LKDVANRARLTATLLVLICGAAASQDPPAFRTDTRLVQINVAVHDKNGPVANLTKDDFILTEKGKTRAISVFAVHKPAAAAPAASAEPPPATPVNTFSNRALRGADAPPSVTVILLDRLNTMIGGTAANAETPLFSSDLALSSAKRHLVTYLDELDPQQRVAIYSLGERITVLSDFTGDRARLKSILENYRATSITSQEVAEPTTVHLASDVMAAQVNRDSQLLAGMSNAQRAQTTMAALIAVAAHVAGIPGRKNLVWLTADLNIPATALARALSRSDIAIYPIDTRGLLSWAAGHSDADDAAAVFGQTRGTPSGTGAGPTVPRGIATMQDLAQETGGRAYANGNDLTGAIRTAINDGEVSYTLGFYPDGNSLDDRFHDLKVRVKHGGYEVRSPRGYFALKDSPVSDAQHQSAVAEAILSPLESSQIHIDATLERGTDSFAVAGSVDLHDVQLSAALTGTVEVSIVQQDTTGKILDQTRNRYNVTLTKESYEAHLKSGLVFREKLAPKEGLAMLRILISDLTDGRVGSLIIPYSQVK
jgi:VWFA-related protein